MATRRNIATICSYAVLAVGVMMLTDRAHAGEMPLREVIDTEVTKVYARESVTPAPMADDATFLRRVHLDLVGTIPTYDETVAFLADAAADKRAKLIDRLLADPRFAEHQAEVWDMVFF